MLREQLTVNPPRTDFFTAVRLIERLTHSRPRIGDDGPFDEEAIVFRHDTSFAFRPNDVSAIRYREDQRPAEERLRGKHQRYEITTCVLGLSGADSPLPLYHAAELIEETAATGPMRAFLDLFHNRLTALFFRAHNKYHWPYEFLTDARDVLSRRALALVGVDVEAEHADGVLSRADLLRIAGLLAYGGGTARVLENSLAALLAPALAGAPVRLEEFTGGWVSFDPAQRIELGRSNSSIGQTFVLGTRVLHPAHRARVVIGPLTPAQAREFAPGGEQFDRVRDLTAKICAEPIGFELELLVAEDDSPQFMIGSVGRPRLGDGLVLTARRTKGRVHSRLFDLDKPTAQM